MVRNFAIVSLAVFGAIAAAQGPQKLVGKPLPAFSLKDTTGKTWTTKDFKGKVVVLDFWATWCGPCKAASKTMQALATKYASKGLVVVAANGFDSASVVAKYRAEHKYTFPFAVDAKAVQDKLGVANLPAIFVIDKSGKVTGVTTAWGDSTPATFEKSVVAALK